jgi:hypothetical protein
MKVLLVAEMDSTAQNCQLANAMRRFLGWNAKSIVCKESYLKYPTDWTSEKNFDEAKEFAQDTDLFIFSDIAVEIEGMGLWDLVTHRNSIINGNGSVMRANLAEYRRMQIEGWNIVPPLCDPTIAQFLSPAPFENWMVPIERIETIIGSIKKNDQLTVCHAPTKIGRKGTEKFREIMAKHTDVEYIEIMGMSWEDAIKEKAKCHIILDSLGDIHYGAGNALEGLVLNQVVIGNISPWCYTLHTDLPMMSTWGKDVEEVVNETIQTLKNEEPSYEKSKRNCKIDELKNTMNEFYNDNEPDTIKRRWIQKHFNEKKKIQQWANYIKWIMEK